MANEEDADDTFTGYKYFVDAKSSRQYAIEFKDDSVVSFNVFNGEKLKPNETVFALDEEQIFDNEGGRGLITTEAYRITPSLVDSEGKPYADGKDHYDIDVSPVTFRNSTSTKPDGTKSYALDVTAESKKELTAEGYVKQGFPLHYDTTGPVESLPPHHPGGATVAHAEITRKLALRAEFNKPYVPNRNWKISDATLEQSLAKYSKDLTALARAKQLDPVVGRDAETDQALKVLIRRKQSSLCFTGEAGVGKTAMFYAIAQRIADKVNLPDTLNGASVLLLDLQAMNAGSSLRGQFEEKLKPIVDGLAERNGTFKGKKVLLAIDELPTQLSAGAAQGTGNAGDAMKPFLTTKGVSVMGTTTDEEYKKHIEKDPALSSRFEKLRLNPPDEASTLVILKKLWPLAKQDNHLTEEMSDADMKYIVTMSNRYAPQVAQPRKAEKVMNMAAASAEFDHRSSINKADIVAAVAQMSGLAPDFLNQSDSERFLKLEEELPKEVLGQPGLAKITDGLIGARSGLNDPNQPWGSFVLQGPTGTGKTEACKALARYLFGDESALIKLDMSDYQQEFDVTKLTGAPPGYVGFEDAEPALTERVRQRPYSILLLDEIEKAHPKVFDKFLSILNDGKMTDNHGKVVLFNNVIVMMTTNLGAKEGQAVVEGRSGMGLEKGKSMDASKQQEALAKVYEKARTGLFRPEMINRIEELGGFVTFIPLSQEAINQIATREIKKVSARLGSADGVNLPGASLEVSEAVMQQLYKEGYNPAMGARPLRKVVREKVNNPLGKWIMGHREEVEAFIKENGPAKLVINSLDLDDKGRPTVTPLLVKADAPAVVNDNKPAVKRAPARKAPARKKADGPV